MIKRILSLIILFLLSFTVMAAGEDGPGKPSQKTLFSPDTAISAFHLGAAAYTDTAPGSTVVDAGILRFEPGGGVSIPDYTPSRLSNDQEKHPAKKRLGRAFLLNYSLVIANSIRYWIQYSKWIEDWQFHLNWEDQKQRWFTAEGYKFDSNPFITNWTHILSGAIYYNFARYNMLNSLESLLFMLGTNFYWEYITEWREVISINDNICTGIGGITIGEPLYWLGSYFTQKPGILNKILGFLFNPVVGLNHLLDANKARSRHGILESNRPDFSLHFGPEALKTGGNAPDLPVNFNLGADIRYYLVEGYGKPADLSRYHKNTLLIEFAGDLTIGASAIEEYRLFTRAVLFGWFRQKLVAGSQNRFNGFHLIFGAGTAFDFYQKKPVAYYDRGEYHYDFEGGEITPQPTDFRDKMAILNLIGPFFEYALYSGDFRFRAASSASFDFGLINSLALNPYSEVADLFLPRIKTTLSYYGYYYALGFTLSADIAAGYRQFDIQGKCKYQYYDSIEGLDRFQEDVEDDSSLKDSRLQLQLSLNYMIPKTPVSIQVAWESIIRDGTLKDISRHTTENRFCTRLKISF